MASAATPGSEADESAQQTDTAEVLREVAKILTPNEDIIFVAAQNVMALSVARDYAIATSNRLILFHPHILGRVDFQDFLWQDVASVTVRQGTLSSELDVQTTDGRSHRMGEIDKDQAKRLYAVCQQMEAEWREKRRVRTMEEERARAGGVYLGQAASATPADDPVERLARAKRMLEQGLISEIEYEALKAKILAAME